MTQIINVTSTDSSIDVTPATGTTANLSEVHTTLVVDSGTGQVLSIASPSYSIDASPSSVKSIDAVATQNSIHITGSGEINAAHTHTVINNDLTVVGELTSASIATGELTSASIATGDVQVQDGTAALPSYSFTQDPDTGLYRYAEDDIGFTTGGSRRFSIASGGISAYVPFFTGNGNAGAPSHSFYNDTDTGMFRVGTNNLGFSTGGQKVGEFNSGTLTVFGPDASTAGKLILRDSGGASEIDDVMIDLWGGAHGFGVEAANTRILSSGGWRFYNAANLRAELTTSGYWRSGNGNAANPTYSFLSDPDTGMYRDGANSIGFSVLGIEKMQIGTGYVNFASAATGAAAIKNSGAGTAATPAYSFGNDTDMGMYRVGTNSLGFSVSGIEQIRMYGADNLNTMRIKNQATSTYASSHAGIWIRATDTTVLGGDYAALALSTYYSSDRHAQLSVYQISGNKLRATSSSNTFIPILASAFTVSSTEQVKNRIRTGRTERGVLDYAIAGPKDLALKQHAKLRPVLFDDLEQEALYEWQGCDEHDDREDCTAAGCDGFDNVLLVEHHCDDYDCFGTSERPCWFVEQHIDRPGLIAEEVLEIYPKAVSRDKYGKIEGIDYAVITVEILNTVQHLIEDRAEMRDRAAAAILANRRLQERLDIVETRLANLETLEARLIALETAL